MLVLTSLDCWMCGGFAVYEYPPFRFAGAELTDYLGTVGGQTERAMIYYVDLDLRSTCMMML